MKLQTFQFIKGTGWTIDTFPPLDGEHTLVLVFAAPEFINDPTPIKELTKHYPHSKIVGCSSAGEILGTLVTDHTIVVAIAQFEQTELQTTTITIQTAEDSFKAGEKVVNNLNKNNLQGIFVLSDGLNINGSELVKRLNTLNKKEVVITGGLAGDGKDFKQTWTMVDEENKTELFMLIERAAFYI